MDWRNLSAILLFTLGVITIWAAANGKFTTVSPAGPDMECEKLKLLARQAVDELKKTEETIFENENMMNESSALVSDQSSKIKELMDVINDLSRKNAALEKENQKLRELLKNALQDIDTLRKRLSVCMAQDAARRLEKQYCDRVPPSNVLR